jgi:beta-galactosidase
VYIKFYVKQITIIMKNAMYYCGIALTVFFASCSRQSVEDKRVKELFDFGWKFYRGNPVGAEFPAFDDSSWRSVDLPHDFSIENIPGTNSPFDANAVSGISGGFTEGGTGWYRKTFLLPEE